MAAKARHRGEEYALVSFTDDAEWVLRDEFGVVRVFEVSSLSPEDQVEVQCERCGRWSRQVAPMDSGRWVCHDTDCYDAEKREGGAGT